MAQRWTFTVHTPLGETHSAWELSEDGLHYESDDPLAETGASVRWDSISEGGTAIMEGMGGRGGPDLPNWVPARMEWLLLARTSEVHDSFMRRLPPPGADRDAIVAAVRDRLGTRWIGEGQPLKDAQRRMRASSASTQWSGLKVAGIVVAVLGMLVLTILLLALLLSPIVLVPAGLVGGGWLLRHGLRLHRDATAAATMAAARIGLAKPGLVHFEAPAASPTPTRAAISGRYCAWWDAAVWVWYESSGSEDSGGWRRVASRHGGGIESVEIGDETGSATVWLNGAELLLELRSWESDKDVLPPRGTALLEALHFLWQGGQRLRVTEECVEVGATLYVIGTLDARHNVPESLEPGRLERIVDALRTGAWRRNVVAAAPSDFMRTVLAVFIGFLDMLTGIGTARMRPRASRTAAPPALAPDARMVWKGRGDRPFLVSDCPEQGALASLRRRAWVTGGIGAAILLFVLYELLS